MTAHQKTVADIAQYGLSVVLVEATDYLPSFAYSIGLWQKSGHPEIICFGLTTKTLHVIINDVADLVKGGQTMELSRVYDNIFDKSSAAFLSVHPGNLPDYFGAGIGFYGTRNFPALQLVWPDRNNKFPWDTDFEEEFTFRQPLLDRNMNFKFREPKNLAAFTTRQWLEEDKPVLRVVHDEDGDWQFLTGDQEPDDIRLVALEQLIQRDNTLNELFDLGYGEGADREFTGGPWSRAPVEEETEET